MKGRWLLSCRSLLPGSSTVRTLMVAAVVFSAAATATGQQANCSLKAKNVVRVISYQGSCSKGFILGEADVLYERKNTDGRFVNVREFGWFSEGIAAGPHIVISPSRTNGAPVALLVYYGYQGKSWFYSLRPAWPGQFDRKTPWFYLPDDDAKQLPPFTDAQGRPLSTGPISSQALFAAFDRYAQQKETLLLKAQQLHDFLSVVSIKNPLANTNSSILKGRLLGSLRPDPDPDTGLVAVQTIDGCTFLVPGAAAKNIEKKTYERYEDLIWDGACVDGWALGPGTVRFNVSGGGGMKYEWVQMGSPVGSYTYGYTGKSRSSDGKDFPSETSFEGYQHPSSPTTYVSKYSVYIAAGPYKTRNLTFSKGSSDGSAFGVRIEPDLCGKRSTSCLTKLKYATNDHEVISPSSEVIPCKADCMTVWNSYASEMDKFIAENKPKVDEVIRANTASLAKGTTLKERTEAAKLVSTAALQKGQALTELVRREDEVKAQKTAETKRVLGEANAARKPVASPNLNALITQIPVIKPKASAVRPKARSK